jgi:hypothetical protein
MNTVRNVRDLGENERQSIENLVGKPLASDQEVFVMVYTPDMPPDEATRARARQRLMQGLEELHADMRRRGVTTEEIEIAIDEAMDDVRRPDP